ncbi:hypothetical protein QBC43DRAFT_303107 [Cladorrhinum sp. PSN259]|nr:hypothetical protein QBC43DRAFT_303107 [Cladorrhinum sp. PSN259]
MDENAQSSDYVVFNPSEFFDAAMCSSNEELNSDNSQEISPSLDEASQSPVTTVTTNQGDARSHPIQCGPVDGSNRTCQCGKYFSRADALKRHLNRVNPVVWKCIVPNCSLAGERGFTRRDHLSQHLMSQHKLSKTQVESLLAAPENFRAGSRENGV